MMSARSIGRAAPRTARIARTPHIGPRRFQSTTSNAAPLGSSHLMSGVVGGIAGAAALYGIYLTTPTGRMASKLNKTAKEVDQKYQQAAATIKDKAPTTDQAIEKLKEFCYSYVAWIPGGRHYVDMAFRDLESIRERNSEEVDKLVQETYSKFQDIAKSGLSMEALSKTYEALADLGQKLAKLGANAADQILENHPQLKEKIGGPVDQLKQMGEQYGPEAKKMVDETWREVGDALSSGASMETVEKVRRLIEEKIQQLQKMGEKAWEKGMEQAKPYLDKNPQVKKLIEENQDLLRKGDASALFNQVKSAVENGDTGKLEDYVKKATEKAKSYTEPKGSMLSSAGGFAGLSQILGSDAQGMAGKAQENITLLTKVVNDHSDEGKKLLEETKDDLMKLLEEKAQRAKKIVDSATQDAKK